MLRTGNVTTGVFKEDCTLNVAKYGGNIAVAVEMIKI